MIYFGAKTRNLAENIEENKTSAPNPDQKYIDALIQNNTSVIEEIYVLYSDAVIQMIKSRGGTVDDAKDVFQDVIISLYHQASKGFELTSSLKSFLLVACKYRYFNKLRKGNKIDSLSDKEWNLENQSQNIVQIMEQDDKQALLYEKVKMLTPTCRELIRLSWQQNDDGKNFSWKEIAEIMDNSYGYIRKKAVECKSRLIELIRKDPVYVELNK